MKIFSRLTGKLLLSLMFTLGCNKTPSGNKPNQDPPGIEEFSVMEESAPARDSDDLQD